MPPLMNTPPLRATNSTVPVVLALLVMLLAAIPLPAAAITSMVWNRALVTQDQLTAAGRSQTLQVSEEILCAIHATHTPWCHLFTHNANDCVLYDLLVDSLADAPPEDQDAVTCSTRHRNVCITEGELHHHGAEVMGDCFTYNCKNRVLVPANNVSTCDAPFSTQDMGCVHLLDEDKKWCEAREYCESLGADLAVVQADKFEFLQQFLADNAGGKQVWVGVKARKWVDLREVDTSEWNEGEPNGVESLCARMHEVGGTYKLSDSGCNSDYHVLCMRK